MQLSSLFTFILVVLIAAFLNDPVLTACSDCAYRGCHPVHDRKLNIHLIAHTHDDAGWLKTADQYYYGGNQNQAEGGVQYIIDSVIGELDADEKRRFVLAETLFLWRWWNDRSNYLRNKMKNFVESGRLQLVGGGWVMSDEATPHYSMIIDQMSFGIRFLKEIFGKCGIPRIAWQIDSFGHSAEQGDEFAKMGYDAVFFGRINQDEYLSRRDRREMEMVWTPYENGSSLFTGVLYNLYQPPEGFCFDAFCHDEPIVDNPRFHGFNVNRRISSFVEKAKIWASAYKTNHVMLTMGGDFHYMVASSWFVNLDKVIRHVNQKYSDVNVIYSTPACYVQAINRLNISWPVKENEDFFPYSSYEKRYWTGYYTSRPNLKFMIARANNLLQVVKKMGVYSNFWSRSDEFEIERILALVQHHDAISGTQRQHVADDYALYLDEAFSRSKDIITRAYRSWGEISETKHSFCMLRNISQCYVSEQKRRFVLYIFNPLTSFSNVTIRLPYGSQTLQAYEKHGSPVQGDEIPIPVSVISIPGRHSTAKHEYVFQASNVPPMGYKTYFVQQQTSVESLNSEGSSSSTDWIEEPMPSAKNKTRQELILGFDDGIQIVLNATSGLLQYVISDGTTWFLEQNFGFYDSNQRWHTSGAYTFAPSSKGLMRFLGTPTFTVHQGNNLIEIHQVFESWVSQVVRLYRGSRSIEFEWLIGPIDLSDSVSKEIVTTYKTHLITNGEFYTDSNGRRWVKRRRDYRGPVHQYGGSIEGNYYPVTSAAMIKDETASLCVLTDRAQGATSGTDGTLELMIHRRLLVDDGKGVTEPLDERAFGTGIVSRGKHIVQFAKLSEAAYLHRTAALAISQGPWISFVPTFRNIAQWQPREVSFLKALLPENINVLTLQKISPTSVLVRLENIFDTDEDDRFSVPTEVDLGALLNRNIKRAREMTLEGNTEQECNRDKLVWRYNTSNNISPVKSSRLNFNSCVLQPMEIRTFVLEVD